MAKATVKRIVGKLVSLLAMLAILIISTKTLPVGNMVLLGVAATALHAIRNYKYTGWISVIACPVLYALSAAIDTPEVGGLYVCYFFSYAIVIIVCCVLEEKNRRKKQ